MSNCLKDRSFKFSLIKQAKILKSNRGIRKLGISSPRDQVVQKVTAMVLKEIYESKFFKQFLWTQI